MNHASRFEGAPWRRKAALAGLVGIVLVAAGVLGASRVAFSYWAGGDSQFGAIAAADQLQAPAPPIVTSSGSSATVAWTAATTIGGANADGYRIERRDEAGTMVPVGSGCSGTVQALRCTEAGIPDGTWSYVITPVLALWAGPASASSAPVYVGASQLSFSTPQRTAVAGEASELLTVERRDANGVPTTSGSLVVSLSSDSPSAVLLNPDGDPLDQGVLTIGPGTSSVSLRIVDSLAGISQVRADADLGSTSQPVEILPAPGAVLAFVAQPTSTAAGSVISPAPSVQVLDRFSNRVTDGSFRVDLTLAADSAEAVLGGTLHATVVDGVAAFSDLSVARAAAGYRLLASSDALGSVASAPFDIAAAAPARLALVAQPGDVVAGTAFTAAVRVEDDYGNTVLSSNVSVGVAVAEGPSGATLSGSVVSQANEAIAAFSDLALERAGSGYRLLFTSAGLEPVATAAFNVGPAAPAKLVFTAQPENAAAGVRVEPAVTIEIRDAFDNLAASGAEVVLSVAAAPPGASPGGTLVRAAASGVASFDDLVFTRIGEYRLAATSPGLASATGTAFTVSHGPAAALVFTQQPPVVSPAGGVFVLRVRIEDALGNLVTSGPAAGYEVALALSGGPGGATLTAPASVAAGGIADFVAVSVNRAGPGYRLVASAAGLTATSSGFDIVAGQPARLEIVAQPTVARAALPISPALGVRVVDALGNAVPGPTMVQVALGANPGAAKLSGTPLRPTVGGLATFPDLAIDKVGDGYTLTATAPGLVGATTAPFAVVGGPPVGIMWTGTTPAVTGCRGIGTATVTGCTSAPVHNKGLLSAAVMLVDVGGNPVVNTGMAIRVTLSAARGDLSATSVTIANGASTSGQFTFTRFPGNGTATVTASTPSGWSVACAVAFTHHEPR